MKRFDPRSLFDRDNAPRYMSNHPYAEIDEVAATAAGTKALTRIGTNVEALYPSGLARAALSRGLAITLVGDGMKRVGHPCYATAYVARPAELWRVPALLRLWKGVRPWPREEPSDAYESHLLGYSRAQTARWHAHLHRWDSFCFYMLLDSKARSRVVALGKRCIGTVADVQKLTFYYAYAPLKRDAHECVPRGLSLARLQINSKIWLGVIGDDRGQPYQKIRVIQPTRKQARVIVEHQHHNVELLTARGWR